MDETREKLVSAATRLFAERGLDGVTVREICTAAHVNGALVNYHFRNKEGLYRECVERIFRQSGGEHVGELVAGVRDARSWKDAVRTWVMTFAKALHATEGGESFAGGIYRQEVVHPSDMHPFIMKHYAVPVRDALLALMRMAGLKEDDAYRWSAAIWSQVSAHALVDARWRKVFRPKGADGAAWSASFVDFICERIFQELRYRP